MTSLPGMNRRHWLVGAVTLPWINMAMATPRFVVDVWKDPSCGCCKDWISHMQKAGFDMRVHEAGRAAAQARLGIAAKFGSCHTASVQGYALEGHVPASDVQRLLKARPKAVGLAVPGMPIGSPGMDGPEYKQRKDPYRVLLIQADGTSSVFQNYL